MKTKTWLIICGVVACPLVIWAIVWSLSSGIPVEAVRVERGPIRQFVDERGKTRLPETYRITMPYHGRIEPVTLTEDAPVKKGDVVARIVPLDLDLSVKETTAVVDRLDAQILENADKKLEITALMQAEKFVESMNATVEAAAARQESGKARFDYAEKNLGRIQQLFEKKAQTQDDLDRAALRKVETAVDYRQDLLVSAAMQSFQAATDLLPTMVQQYISNKSLAEAVLKKHKAEATAQLRQVEQQQQRGTMRSPTDGVVLSRYSSNERYLAAGTELLEIGRLEDLEIEADILSLDVVDTKEGDEVEIYGPAIGRPHAGGRVTRIYPAGFTKISSLGVEQQRVKVIIRFNKEDEADKENFKRLLDERHLGVGYRVRVRITTDREPKALVIPRSALFRSSGGKWQVYTVSDGYARIKNVEIGILNDRQAQVTAGLAEGELVVRAPESNLSEGQRVKLIPDEEQPR